MAILDKALIFFNNEVLESGAVANIDLGVGGDAIGQELTLTIVANEAVGAEMQFVLGTLDEPATTDTAGQQEVNGALVISPATSSSVKPAGTVIFQCRVPKGARRYLYLAEVNGTGSAGKKITAYLSKEL
jgi:hypothetical protein